MSCWLVHAFNLSAQEGEAEAGGSLIFEASLFYTEKAKATKTPSPTPPPQNLVYNSFSKDWSQVSGTGFGFSIVEELEVI